MIKTRLANASGALLEQEETATLIPNGVSPYVKHPLFSDLPYWHERQYANSYGHVLGLTQLGWVQPGQLVLSNKPLNITNENAEVLRENLELDKLESVSLQECDYTKDHVFAVVLKPRNGFELGKYQCVRINEGGQLSEIEGGHGVSRRSLKSMSIKFRMLAKNTRNFFDVLKPADFLTEKYPEFVGFFRIPEEGIPFTPIYRPQNMSELNYPYQPKGQGGGPSLP